jgi:hypothetical protein
MITIRQFQRIDAIKKQNYGKLKEEMLIVGVLNNMTERQIHDTKIEAYRELTKLINLVDFKPPQTLIPEFTHEGVKYKVDTIFKVSGQFIDFDNLRKDPIANLHLILSLFAYEGDNYTHNVSERAEKFLDVDYRIAYSVAFFFSRFMKELSKSIRISLQGQEADGMKRNGVGKQRSTVSATGTEQSGSFLHKWTPRRFLGILRK